MLRRYRRGDGRAGLQNTAKKRRRNTKILLRTVCSLEQCHLVTTMIPTSTTNRSDSQRLLQLIKRGDRNAATFVLMSLTAATTTVSAAAWLELQDDDGDGTALIWAACHGFEELVAMLLAAGADVNARAATNGLTALHAAAERGRTTVVRSVLLPLALHCIL